MKWLHGGTPLRNHRLPISQPDLGVVTSLAMDQDWIVAGLSDTKIHVFSRRTGMLTRTLVGCQGGVWAVWLVEKGLWSSPSPRKKNPNSGSAGWGQATSLVVSGGCDKAVRVWDVETGYGDARLFVVCSDPLSVGDVYIPLRVIEQRSIALVSWITARLPFQAPEIPHLGSGTSNLDDCYAYWKDTSRASVVWTCMAQPLSVGVMTTPAE